MKLSLKFLPIKDMFYSVIPTVGTYEGYLQGIAPKLFPNQWIALGIGIVLSIILAFVFYFENVKAYKKSLAEILATGYFMNFTGRLGKLLKTKTPIHFSFPDGSIKTFTSNLISVEIGMPVSLSTLVKYSEKVEMNSDIVYVREETYSEPFWVRADILDTKLIIYEFPRTLFSISRYLRKDFINTAKAEKNSKKIYSYFSDKIDELRIEYSNEISNERLHFISV
ncbi:STING domain-containing protein [Muriicola sp. E247]|uniref:STING domain-containing protein n=1 Tax=Muriicola sp. E247 TaxID=3242730 RepID=UPI0035246E40